MFAWIFAAEIAPSMVLAPVPPMLVDVTTPFTSTAAAPPSNVLLPCAMLLSWLPLMASVLFVAILPAATLRSLVVLVVLPSALRILVMISAFATAVPVPAALSKNALPTL